MKFCRNLVLSLLLALISFSVCESVQAHPVEKNGQKDLKQAVLLVGFGSTRPEASAEYKKGLDTLEGQVRKAHPSMKVFRSSSSRNFLQSEQGKAQGAQSTEQVLATLATQGYNRVFVQSLHITSGNEYGDLMNIADAFSSMPKGLDEIDVSGPLLGSAADAENLAKVLVAEEKVRPGEVVIFVGHGGQKASDLSLLALQAALWRISPAYLVHGLESKPDFAEVAAELKRFGAKEVRLVPLMAVAGEHALNDIGGLKDKNDDAESLFMRLTALGYKCSVVKNGLLARPAVLQLWCDKLAALVAEASAK